MGIVFCVRNTTMLPHLHNSINPAALITAGLSFSFGYINADGYRKHLFTARQARFLYYSYLNDIQDQKKIIMKQLPLITAGILICCACNEPSGSTATKHSNAKDSTVNNKVTDPTPGLGYDPTRNDAAKKNAFSDQGAVDSTGPSNNDKPTPGVGNDPTRNNPSNSYSTPDDKNKQRADTGIKKY